MDVWLTSLSEGQNYKLNCVEKRYDNTVWCHVSCLLLSFIRTQNFLRLMLQ